mgnify:CR=1 FL=1
MKKTIFYSLFSALFMLTSCSMFEIDNYENRQKQFGASGR